MRKIEVPSGEHAEELQKHLLEKRFSGVTYDKSRRVVQFPDDVNESQWSNARDEIEKWAKGKRLEVVESLRLQYPKPAGTQEAASPKAQNVDVGDIKKKVSSLPADKAEERFRYLSSKPFSELTEAEYHERMALAQRPPDKKKPK